VALAAAYTACERIAREHYENFPVASFLLPKRMRPHVAAVYAFARTADDFADEDGLSAQDRLARLDEWGRRLHAAAGTAPRADESSMLSASGTQLPADRIFEALGATLRTCNLEVTLFDDLLSAFRQDVTVHRYEQWEHVFDYCRRSANPVGRIVLRIAGYRDARLDRSSDALCTALQLTNFWQDLAIDWKRGRLYVPTAIRDAASARDEDLDQGRITPAWRIALAQAVSVTRTLFDEGRFVCDGVAGRLRLELRATWTAASRILDRIEAAGCDVFTVRPRLGPRDALPVVWRMLRWHRNRELRIEN
jgi:squalene synthase HpnC